MELNAVLSQVSEWLGVFAVAMMAGASARFARRPLLFRYNRREVIFALSLFALVLAVSVLLYVFIRPPLFSAEQPARPLGRLLLALGAVVPFVIALLARGQPVRAIGWGGLTLRPSLLMGLALGLLAIILRGKSSALLSGLSAEQGSALLLWLLVALAEETIFRGYIHLRLVSAWGQWPGILATALLYATWQLPRLAAQSLPLETLALQGMLAFVHGVVLGYLMQRTGNVAAPGIYRGISEWLSVLS